MSPELVKLSLAEQWTTSLASFVFAVVMLMRAPTTLRNRWYSALSMLAGGLFLVTSCNRTVATATEQEPSG